MEVPIMNIVLFKFASDEGCSHKLLDNFWGDHSTCLDMCCVFANIAISLSDIGCHSRFFVEVEVVLV